MPVNLSTAESLASLPEAQRKEILASLTDAQHEDLLWDWEFWARQAQKEPDGDWQTWLILAGRGYGKTKTGAETIRKWACGKTPLAKGRYRRFLLIAETAADARDVMVEGEAGILSVHPREFRPLYEPSKRRLTWPNGATASLFNATEPDQLRGPQGDAAWCLTGDTLVRMGDDGEKPIKDVRPGDWVQTRAGSKRVLAQALTRQNTEVLRLFTVGGQTISGTADHPVWVQGRGFTPFASLQIGMGLCAIAASTSTASAGTAKQAGITRLRHPDCTERFGKRLMGLFLEALRFTTKTRTRATTTSKTSNCSPAAPTLSCISSKRLVHIAPKLGKTRSLHERGMPRFGWRVIFTAPYVARVTTAVLLTRLGSVLQAALRLQGLELLPANGDCVSFVAPYTTPPGECSGIAQRHATIGRQQRGPPSVLSGILRAVRAAFSSQASGQMPASAPAIAPSTFTQKIVSVERLAQRANVYDIAIEGAAEFFANGILVHNCDELAKWQYARETWDMLQFGLRLGDHPRQIVTTTPRPISVIKELLADDTTVVTRGTTMENRGNLAPSFLRKIQSRYEGTRLGRQELNAEVLDDNPNALWTRGMIEAALIKACPELTRIVVAVDPSGTDGQDEGDDIGIIAAGRGVDGKMYVLEDATCQMSPAGWGGVTVSLYKKIGADRVVGEKNFGGAMVRHVIHTADATAAYKEVVASRGKWLRAEPIAALYEQGRIKHVGSLPKLEDEMCAFGPDGLADGKSPNRLDALVWAGTELMLGGETMVFSAPEADIIVDAFDIPVTWPRVFVVEVTKDRVAVVWGAVDRDAETIYLYNEYAAQRGDMAILAAAIRDRQAWIPGVMNLTGKGRPKDETHTIADRLESLRLNLTLVDVDTAGATEKTTARLGSQRLKVFRHLSGWTRQYRNYCHDDKGNIVTTDSGLIEATILLCAEGLDHAAVKAKPPKDRGAAQRSAWGV